MVTLDFGKLTYLPRLVQKIELGLRLFRRINYAFDRFEMQVNGFCSLHFVPNGVHTVKSISVEVRHFLCRNFILFETEFEASLYEHSPNYVVEYISNQIDHFLSGIDVRKVKVCELCSNRPMINTDTCCEKCASFFSQHNEVCPICLDENKKIDIWKELAVCKHVFHAGCLSKMIKYNVEHNVVNKCPICREPGLLGITL
jgi:hypothetical protein